MQIGEVVKELQNGNKVARKGWNGKGMFLFFVANWEPTNITVPGAGIKRCQFVAMRTADGSFIPWLCSQSDLLAIDWEIV